MLPQTVRQGQVGDEGGFAEITFVEDTAALDLAAGQELAAGLVDLFGEVLEVLVGALVDHRTEEVGALGWVADGQFFGQRLSALRPVHRRPALRYKTREAAEHFCPCKPKAERTMPAAARSRSAWRETMAGFLPPSSRMIGRTYLPSGKVLEHLHAHIEGAGEGHPVHFRAVDQGLAEGPARAGDEVADTVRQAGIPEAFGQQADDPGSIGGGFDDDGVAGDERRAGRAARQGEGEVERAEQPARRRKAAGPRCWWHRSRPAGPCPFRRYNRYWPPSGRRRSGSGRRSRRCRPGFPCGSCRLPGP